MCATTRYSIRPPSPLLKAVGVIAIATVLAPTFFAIRKLGRPATPAVLVTATLLALAGARIVAPLQFVDHQSELAQLKHRLDADRAAGRAIPSPLEVRGAGKVLVHYYFADDYQIVGRLDRWQLFEKEPEKTLRN